MTQSIRHRQGEITHCPWITVNSLSAHYQTTWRKCSIWKTRSIYYSLQSKGKEWKTAHVPLFHEVIIPWIYSSVSYAFGLFAFATYTWYVLRSGNKDQEFICLSPTLSCYNDSPTGLKPVRNFDIIHCGQWLEALFEDPLQPHFKTRKYSCLNNW